MDLSRIRSAQDRAYQPHPSPPAWPWATGHPRRPAVRL